VSRVECRSWPIVNRPGTINADEAMDSNFLTDPKLC